MHCQRQRKRKWKEKSSHRGKVRKKHFENDSYERLIHGEVKSEIQMKWKVLNLNRKKDGYRRREKRRKKERKCIFVTISEFWSESQFRVQLMSTELNVYHLVSPMNVRWTERAPFPRNEIVRTKKIKFCSNFFFICLSLFSSLILL